MILKSQKHKNKMSSHKKKRIQKEIEIPVHVVKKIEEKDDLNPQLKIIRDKDDLPHLETSFKVHQNSPAVEEGAKQEAEQAEKQRNEKKEKEIMESNQVENLNWSFSASQKKKILWVSVLLISGIIFFIWLTFFKNNFSFSFGRSNFFALSKETDNLQSLHDEWETLRDQWVNFQNALEQQKAAESASQQVINKLQEKILVEEMEKKVHEKLNNQNTE